MIWEYKVVTHSLRSEFGVETVLNALGTYGWELVSVTKIKINDTFLTTLYLKKEIK